MKIRRETLIQTHSQAYTEPGRPSPPYPYTKSELRLWTLTWAKWCHWWRSTFTTRSEAQFLHISHHEGRLFSDTLGTGRTLLGPLLWPVKGNWPGLLVSGQSSWMSDHWSVCGSGVPWVHVWGWRVVLCASDEYEWTHICCVSKGLSRCVL